MGLSFSSPRVGHLHTWIRADKAVLHLNLQTLRVIQEVLVRATWGATWAGLVVAALRDIQAMVATADRRKATVLTVTAVVAAAAKVTSMAPTAAALDSLVKAPVA